MRQLFDWFSWTAYGSFDVAERECYDRLIGSLESLGQNAPRTWAPHDGGASIPFDAGTIWEVIAAHPRESEIHLSQLGMNGRATISASRWPRVSVSCGSLDSEHARAWFEPLSGATAALKPDISIFNIGTDLPTVSSGKPVWETPLQRSIKVLGSCAPAYNDYYRIGPRGLGVRTVLGPHFVTQFGRSLLMSTPIHVTELDWGGVQLDLLEEPWTASMEELVGAWRRGMEHLAPAGIFAEVQIDEERKRIRYLRKGPNVVIGGVLPKES